MPGTLLLDSEGLSKHMTSPKTSPTGPRHCCPAITSTATSTRSTPFFAAAHTAPKPVTVLTSDPEEVSLLCGPAIEVIKV